MSSFSAFKSSTWDAKEAPSSEEMATDIGVDGSQTEVG